jgi:hypothetical protein
MSHHRDTGISISVKGLRRDNEVDITVPAKQFSQFAYPARLTLTCIKKAVDSTPIL